MRYLIALIAALWTVWASVAMAQDWEDQRRFNGEAPVTLRILSSTDTAFFAPLITAFVAQNPSVAVDYRVTGTQEVDRRFRADPGAHDIVISSAMDLQLKLTNDGHAARLPDLVHPDWARWRQSLFAFTSEPAAIVLNRAAFAGHPIPRSRQELIEALRARPEVFRGRIGTYDVRASGVGYLFATQDARASESFWRLMEVMGSLDARLYCCSGEMIDDLVRGDLAVAYNVLGSYAMARADTRAALRIVLPSDFPTTMMRTAFVSRESRATAAATAFMAHLLRYPSRGTEDAPALPGLDGDAKGAARGTIALEPALMTFLDRLKRSQFIAEWENALVQK